MVILVAVDPLVDTAVELELTITIQVVALAEDIPVVVHPITVVVGLAAELVRSTMVQIRSILLVQMQELEWS